MSVNEGGDIPVYAQLRGKNALPTGVSSSSCLAHIQQLLLQRKKNEKKRENLHHFVPLQMARISESDESWAH